MDFILWMDYTSAQPRKSFGILDEELSFYLELPMEWYGNLMLTDGPEENQVELRSQDGQAAVFDGADHRQIRPHIGLDRLGVVSNRLDRHSSDRMWWWQTSCTGCPARSISCEEVKGW